MATKPYNISDLRMITPRYRSAGAEILSIRVWNGNCLININMDKTPKPIFNKHWKINEVFTIARYMQDFAKAEPNTDKTLVFNTFNRIEKKRLMDYVLIFRKDERKLFHIIIKSGGQTYDFLIKGIADIAFGTGEINEEERSYNEWLYLINFLKTMVPMQMQLSSFPIETPQGGQGEFQRSPGGYGRGSSGGYRNQNDFQPSPRNLPSDDDIFE